MRAGGGSAGSTWERELHLPSVDLGVVKAQVQRLLLNPFLVCSAPGACGTSVPGENQCCAVFRIRSATSHSERDQNVRSVRTVLPALGALRPLCRVNRAEFPGLFFFQAYGHCRRK